jgi:site-specific DNA-cytosine methylase
MKVLSLFDGMSAGKLALERAGVKVSSYYASEVDKYAIEISQKNYPDIIRLGDVVNVKAEDLPPIDLLIGGSPCQGFSCAGKQLNFDDPRSKLFFEYVRLLKEVKPKYFLLENVVMKQEYQDIISEALGVKPIMINSSSLSGQIRKRLYWTNIPNVTQPADKGVSLQSILTENGYTEKNKSWAIACASSWIRPMMSIEKAKVRYKKCLLPIIFNSSDFNWELGFRFLNITECERLQTFPDNFTEGVSKSQRYKMLGNGWTVDVIAHIFRGLL